MSSLTNKAIPTLVLNSFNIHKQHSTVLQPIQCILQHNTFLETMQFSPTINTIHFTTTQHSLTTSSLCQCLVQVLVSSFMTFLCLFYSHCVPSLCFYQGIFSCPSDHKNTQTLITQMTAACFESQQKKTKNQKTLNF